MFTRTLCIAAAAAALLATPAFAQSLKDKAGFGGNLNAVEATAILAAEIKYCESSSPDFKAQAGPQVDRLRADARYKEIERNPEFARLAPEALALVKDRNQGASPATVCRNTLQRLK
jgi:hypothetical protein